jgi:membrane-associated phospholipid phosphatase
VNVVKPSHRWVVAGTLVLCAIAVAEFTRELSEDDDVSRLDQRIAEQAVELRSENLTEFARAVTALASTEAILVVTAVGVATALVRRRRSQAIGVATAALLATTLVLTLKHLVGRDRPPPPVSLTDQATNAYPSGHAAFAVAVWGAAVWALVVGRSRLARTIAACATVFVIGMIGASRIYLGAHWSSDVVAGWAVGGVALTTGLLIAGSNDDAGATDPDATDPARE